MLKTYKVLYDGLWLGGTAIVRAESEEEAIEFVKNDENTVDFTDVKCEKIDTKRGVVYNDNGDY